MKINKLNSLVELFLKKLETIDNDKPTFAFTPAPKPMTKAERKAAKAAVKRVENETANSQDN